MAWSTTTTRRLPMWMQPRRPGRVSRRHSPDSRRQGQGNSDYTTLSPLLRERVRAIYTIGAAAAKIESHLRGVAPIHSCETLANAVAHAAVAARGPAKWCCWRRPAPASISLRTTSSADASSSSLVADQKDWKAERVGAVGAFCEEGTTFSRMKRVEGLEDRRETWRSELALTNGCSSPRWCWWSPGW
jgi:hypothetical protein